MARGDISPYRPGAASADPRERLADRPRRVRGALTGFVALAVCCALALAVRTVVLVLGR